MKRPFWTCVSVTSTGLIVLALVSSTRAADSVTLQNGGVLRGKAVRTHATVAVTTSTGAHIVLEQAAVKAVRHQPNPASNTAHRQKMTAAQKAWFPKVHKLINQLNGESHEAAGRAMRDLRAITDPDAIPALGEYLRTSNNEQSRLLYVRILGEMRGTNAVVSLIEEALFDSSFVVRTAAQKAGEKQESQNVRPYYDQALHFPNRRVVNRAADALSTVGNKENVPSLINSLYSREIDIVIQPGCCMSRVTYLMMPRGGSYNRPYLMTGFVDPPEMRREMHWAPNPQVREALERITKRSYGYNTDAWRRWWQSEQLAEANRRKLDR